MENISKVRTLSYYLLMFLFSLLFLAIASEMMVRWLVPKETFWPISNIYQAVDTPAVGYTLKPHFDGIAFGVDLKTNHLGFRGDEWQLEKPVGTFRIALIGDSHAFGFGVPFQDSVGEKLAALLNQQGGGNYEILNFGVNGYNGEQELAVLREYALQYQPDMVIVIASSNDHEKARVVDQQGWLHWDDSTQSQTRIHDNSIDKMKLENVSWLVQHSRLILYFKLLKKRYAFAQEAHKQPQQSAEKSAVNNWMGPFPSGAVSQRLKEPVYKPLKAMIAETKQRNIPIIIANFNAILDYRQLFEKLSKEDAIHTLELLALFPEVDSWQELVAQFSLGWNNHLNAIAHQRWAVALAQLLEKQDYLPPKEDLLK